MFPFKVYNYDELPQSVVSQLANGPLSTDAVQVAAYDISPDHYLLLIPTDASPCTPVSSSSGSSKAVVQGAVDNSDARCQTPVVHLKPFSSPTSTEKPNSNVNLGAMNKPDANSDGYNGSKDNAGENTVNFDPVKLPTHCKMKKCMRNSDVDYDSMNEPDNCDSKNDMMQNSVNYGGPLNIVKRNHVVNFGSMSTKRRNPFVKLNAVNIRERNDSALDREKINITNLTSDVDFGVVNTSNGESDNFDSNESDTNPDVNCHSRNVTENTVNYVSTPLNTERTNSGDSLTKSVINHDTRENSANYGQPVNVKGNPVVNNCGSMGIKWRNQFSKLNRANIEEKNPIPSNKINILNLTTDVDFSETNTINGEYNVSFDSMYEHGTNPNINYLSENDTTKNTDNCDPVNTPLNTNSDSFTKSVFNYVGSWENVNYGHSVNIVKRNSINCGSVGIKRRNPFVKFNPSTIAKKNPISSEKINISNLTTDVNFGAVNSTNGESEINCHLKNPKNRVNNCDLINITKVNNNINFVVMATVETNLDINENPINIAEEINHFDSNPIDTADEFGAYCDSKNTADRDLLNNCDPSCCAEDKLCGTKNSINSDSMHVVGDNHSVDNDSKNTANKNPIDIRDQVNIEDKISFDPDSNICVNSTKRNPMCIAGDIHSVDFDLKNFADRNLIDNNLINTERESSCDPKNNTDMNTTVNRNPMYISEDTHNINCDPNNTAKGHPPYVISFNEEKLLHTENSENGSVINNDSTHIVGDNQNVNCDVKNTENLNPIDYIDQVNSAHEDSSDPINKTDVNPTVNCNSMPISEDTHNINSNYQNTANGNPLYNIDILSPAKEKLFDTKNLANRKAINTDSTHSVEDNRCVDCDFKNTADKNPIHDSDLINTGQENSYDSKGITDKNPTINNSIARGAHYVNFDPQNPADSNPIDNTDAINGNPRYFVEGNPNGNFDYSAEYNPIEDNNLVNFSDENPFDHKNTAGKNTIAKSYPMHIAEHNYSVNCDSNNTTYKNFSHNNDLMNTIEKISCENNAGSSTADMNPVVNSNLLKSGKNIDNNYDNKNYSTGNSDLTNMEKKNSCDPMNTDNFNSMTTPKKYHNSDPQNVINKISFINSKPINRAEDNPNINCDPHTVADKYFFMNSKQMNTAEENPNNCDSHNSADKYSFINGRPTNSAEQNPNISCRPHNIADTYSFINGRLMNTIEKNPNISYHSQYAANKLSFINYKQINTAEKNPNINCDPQDATDNNTFLNSKPVNIAEDNPEINCDPQNAAVKNTFMNWKPTNTAEKNKLNTTEDNPNINSQNVAEKNCFINSKPMNTAEGKPNTNCDFQNATDKNYFNNSKPMNRMEDNPNNCEPQNTTNRNLIFISNPMSAAEENLNINCDLQNTTDRNIIINSNLMSTAEDNANINLDPPNSTDRILINRNPKNTAEGNAVLHKNTNQNIANKYSAEEHFNVNYTTLNNTNNNPEVHLNSSNSAALSKNNKCTPMNNTQNNPDKCNPNNSIDSKESGSGICFLEENTSRFKTVDSKISGEDLLDLNSPELQCHSLSRNIPTCLVETEYVHNPLDQCVNGLPIASTNSLLKEKYESMFGMKSSLRVNCASHTEGHKHSLKFEPKLEKLKLLKTKIDNLKSGNFPRSNLIGESPIATVDLLNTVKSKPNFNAKCENLSILKERYILLASKGKDIVKNTPFEMDKNKMESFKTKIAHLKSIVCYNRNSMYENGISITNLIQSRSAIQSQQCNETKIKELISLKENFKSQLSAKSKLNNKGAIANNIQGNKFFDLSPQLVQNLKAQRKQQIYATFLSTFHPHNNKTESLNTQVQPNCSYVGKKHRKLIIRKTIAEQLNNSLLKRNIPIGASSCIQKNKEQIVNPGMASTSKPLQLPSMPSVIFNEQCKEKGSGKESYSQSPVKIFILNKPVPIISQNHKLDSVLQNQKPGIQNAVSKPEKSYIFENNSRLLSVRQLLKASIRPKINSCQILSCNRTPPTNIPSGQSTYIPLNTLNLQSKGNNSEKESNSHLDSHRTVCILNKPIPASCNLNKKSKTVSILYKHKPEICSAATKAEKDQFKNSSEMHFSLLNSKASEINLNQILNCNNASILKPSEQSASIPLYTLPLNKPVSASCNLNKESKIVSIMCKQKPAICSAEDSYIKIFKLNKPIPPNNLNEKSDYGQLNQKLGICNIVPNPEKSETFKDSSLLLYSKASAELNEKNQNFNSNCASAFKFSEQLPLIPSNALNLQLLQKSSENASDSQVNVIVLNQSALPKPSLTERSKFISVQHNPDSRLGSVTFKSDAKNKCSSKSWELYSKSSTHSYSKLNEESNYNNASAKNSSHSEIVELNFKVNCNNSSAKKSIHSEMKLNEKSNCNNSSDRKSHSEIELNKKLNCNNSSSKTSHSEIKLNDKLNCKCSNSLEQRLFFSSNAFNPQCTKNCLDTKYTSQLDSDHIPILNYRISETPTKYILKKKFRLVTNEQEQNNKITKKNSKRKIFTFPEPFKMQLIDKGATLQNSVFQKFDNSTGCEVDPTMQHLSKESVVASPDATKPFYKEINKSELHNLKSSCESFVPELENNKIIHEDNSPKPLKKSAVSLHNSTPISPNYSYKRKNYENSKIKYLVVQLQRLPPEVINCYLSGKNAGTRRSSNGNELPMVFQKQPEYICDMTWKNECRKRQCKRKINMDEITNQRKKIQRVEKCSEDGFVGKDCFSISTDANNSMVCVGTDSFTFSTDKNISSNLGVSKEVFLSNPNLPLTSDSEYIFDFNSYKEGRNKQCKRKIITPGVVNVIENKKKIDYGFECREFFFDDVGSDCSSTSTDATLSADEGASMEPFSSNFQEIENSRNCVIAKEFSSATSQKLPIFISESTSYESTFDSWSTRKKLTHLRDRVASYKTALKVVSKSRKSIWRVATTHKELRVRLFKLPYLPNEIKVPLVKLPDLIYEKQTKGKPIMLSNVMPLLGTDSDKNAPEVVSTIPEILPQSEAPHNDSIVSLNKLPCLPNKLKVDLFKLPDYIYEKHTKGKPIMLSNILPTIYKVESVSVNEPLQISSTVVKIERLEDESL